MIVDRLTVHPGPVATRGGKSTRVADHAYVEHTHISINGGCVHYFEVNPESLMTCMTGRLSGEHASKNGKDRERSASPASFRTGVRDRLDPEEYQPAKKELKKAILQYYRYAITNCLL